MNKITESVKSEKGFYVGDICYVLADKLYHGVWGEAHYHDGKYKDPETGFEFAVAGTAYGDGEYCDQDGNAYGVDAGVIGIVPLELVTDFSGCENGRVCMGAGIANFTADNGCFEIGTPKDGTILIDTRAECEEDEWEDD